MARFLASGAKNLNEIGKRINKLYPDIEPDGNWIKEPLTKWNPFVERENDKFRLSNLGRALISLPGREGDPPTESERAFLLGVMLFDERQRRIMSELVLAGKSTDADSWVVDCTRACLKKLRIGISGIARSSHN